jgi:four helix bundle protein
MGERAAPELAIVIGNRAGAVKRTAGCARGLPHRGSVLDAVQAGAGCAGAREDAGSLDSVCARCGEAGYALASRRALEQEHSFMALQVAVLSIELIETLCPLMPRIKQRDKSLADQLSRAASSIALNIGEAELSDPGNRKARLFTAAGSANETLTALRVAVAWRLSARAEAEAAMALLRRIVAILWRMTRG